MLEPRDYWDARYRLAGRQPLAPTPFGSRAAGWVEAMQAALGRSIAVLELGCGAGRDARALAAAGAQVTAVDVSPTALAGLEALTGVTPVVADLREPLPFVSSTFDAVYSHFVLSCAFREAEVSAVMAEIGRVLHPGGELWLCVRSTDDPIYCMSSQSGAGFHSMGETGLHFFSRRSLRRQLAGFDLMEMNSGRLTVDGEPYGAIGVRAIRCGLNSSRTA